MAMTSSGTRSKIVEEYSIRRGIEKISIEVSEDCSKTLVLTDPEGSEFELVSGWTGRLQPWPSRRPAAKYLTRTGDLLTAKLD